MLSDDDRKTVQVFLGKMDAGELDGNLLTEVQDLTQEQRFELVRLLMERDAGESNQSSHSVGSKG
jgi:hypothetical protein